jgi:peptidoglycan/LPS O-acetylase OafA/YrhL
VYLLHYGLIQLIMKSFIYQRLASHPGVEILVRVGLTVGAAALSGHFMESRVLRPKKYFAFRAAVELPTVWELTTSAYR